MQAHLSNDWSNIQEIIVYGFGKTSQGNIDYLMKSFHIKAIIDNNEKYAQGGSYNGISIYNADHFKFQKEKIVILAAGKALLSIKNSLESMGKREYYDYVDVDCFVTEWFNRFQNKLCLGKVTTSVTTKCTFNCKNCNMLMPYYNNPQDYDLAMLKRDADLFFQFVDFVTSFVIIGGEPFLYNNLVDYIEYIGTNYRKRIGNILLITNGSIKPNDEVLDTLLSFDCEVRFSNYLREIPYENRYNEVKNLLVQKGIRVIEFIQTEWIDFGFPHDNVNMGNSPEELRRHMLNCHGLCHFLHGGKYYFCSNAWTAQECGKFLLIENQDYINLERLDHETGREYLLNFHVGNMEHGYMNFCKVCRGFSSKITIKAGVQLPRAKRGT